MKKRLLSVLVMLCVALALFPAAAFAADASGETAAATATVEDVQRLIDALPEAEDITSENRDAVSAQLAEIDDVRALVADEEALKALDETKYDAAMEMIVGTPLSLLIIMMVVVFLILAVLILLVSLVGKLFVAADKRKKEQQGQGKNNRNNQNGTSAAGGSSGGAGAASVGAGMQLASALDPEDDEIVAVITAALAAYESETGVRGVIRSIRRTSAASRSRSVWAQAGVMQNVAQFGG